MKKINLLFSLLICLVFLYSCGKEELISEKETTIDQMEIRNGNMSNGSLTLRSAGPEVQNARLSLARYLSLAMDRNESFGQLLVEMTLDYQRTGYYETEFFFNLVKDIPQLVLGGNSIAQALIGGFPDEDVSGVLDILENEDPGLAILLEGDIEAATLSGKVFVDNGFDDQDLSEVIPYYENGTSAGMDLGSAENWPEQVLVVRQSEAYMSPERIATGRYDSDNFEIIGQVGGDDLIIYDFCPRRDCGNDDGPEDDPAGDDGDGPDTPDPCLGCDRDCEDGKENIHTVYAGKSHENLSGKGEFMFYVILTDNISYTENEDGEIEITGDALSSVTKGPTSIKKKKWTIVDLDIVRWDLEKDGDRFKYIVYEDDTSFNIDFTTELSFDFLGISVTEEITFSIGWGDDFVGECIIDYCDPILYNNGPGGEFRFKNNERIE